MTRTRRLLVAFYLTMAAVGLVVPYAILLAAIVAGRGDGFNVPAFFGGIFANPAAAIFSMDAILSSVVFLAVVVVEGRRANMRRLWAYPLVNLLVGLCCVLPLFLAMREKALPPEQHA